MKKTIALLVICLCAGGGGVLSALDLSAGGGAVFNTYFGGGFDEKEVDFITTSSEMPQINFGFYGFFDATYVEASVGLLFGSINGKTTMKIFGYTLSVEQKFSITTLTLGLLGKYPFYINDRITLFPAAGIEYQLVLAATDNGVSYDDAGDLSSLVIKLGGGIDFDITNRLYLRGTILYGLRFPNKLETDLAKEFDVTAAFGHGPTIRAAIGFRF